MTGRDLGYEQLPSVNDIRSAGLSWPNGRSVSLAVLIFESFVQTGSAQAALDLMPPKDLVCNNS